MTLSESYFFLFYDSFLSALILFPRTEMAIKAMIALQIYNPILIFFIAQLASLLALSINWRLGKYLMEKYLIFLHHNGSFERRQKEILDAEKKWQKFVVWILFFCWLNIVGSTFSTMAGFFKTSFKKFFCLVFVGKFCYYSLLILVDFDLKTYFF
ncbi:MAG: hypothetical protein SFV53_06090 [Rickettsiales bacterium]|nr:hypothetical protein [Rickettsiales bacterium]